MESESHPWAAHRPRSPSPGTAGSAQTLLQEALLLSLQRKEQTPDPPCPLLHCSGPLWAAVSAPELILSPGASGLSKSFPFPWLAGPRPRPTLAQQHKVTPALAAAAPGDSRWLQLLLSPAWRGFLGRKALPSPHPLILAFESRLQPRVSAVFLCSPRPGLGLKLRPEMQRKQRNGSCLTATAGMAGRPDSPFQRGSRAANLCALGFSRPPSVLKLCFPPSQPAPGATKAPPAPRVGGCSGRHADTQPLPGSLPSVQGQEHIPRTRQWEFGVFICNPAMTPGLRGE